MSRGRFSPRAHHEYAESVQQQRAQIARSSFYVSDNLRLLTDVDSFVLTGVIACEGGVRIAVTERVRLVRNAGFWRRHRHSPVELVSYGYNVSAHIGNVFRYDSPDMMETGDTPEHHRFHHVHRFDVFGSGQAAWPPDEVKERDVPSFRQVFHEAERWYWTNRERL